VAFFICHSRSDACGKNHSQSDAFGKIHEFSRKKEFKMQDISMYPPENKLIKCPAIIDSG